MVHRRDSEQLRPEFVYPAYPSKREAAASGCHIRQPRTEGDEHHIVESTRRESVEIAADGVSILGQYLLPLPSGGQHNGAIDIVELGSTGKSFIPQDPVTLTLNISGDGTGSNPQYDFLTANAPAANLKFKAYFVSQQKVYLLGNQPSTVDLGVATQQH